MAGTTQGLTEQSALGIIAMVSGILALLLVLPYLQYVLLAVVLAYALAPLQTVLERILSPTASALSLIGGSLLVLILPVIYVLVIAVRQASELARTVQRQGLSPTAIQQQFEMFGYQVDPGDASRRTRRTRLRSTTGCTEWLPGRSRLSAASLRSCSASR